MTAPTTSPAPRARALGLPFSGTPGAWNALTDVPGVEVGMVTLVEGDGTLVPGAGPVRTGVTAIHPRGRAGATTSCAAGMFSLNGNGEMTGSHWIAETGGLHTPVVLTNSHAVGPCSRGVVEWMTTCHPELRDQWVLPVVAETFDGYLNDIDGPHVQPHHAASALDDARTGPFPLGSVGGGTGMSCYDFKGGVGSASRLVELAGTSYTLAVLVQANFGSRSELTIAGVPVGAALLDDQPMANDPTWGVPPGAGSVIVVVATDAPLLPQQCAALARRVPLGLARTGTTGSHFSGDLFLAFSTANPGALQSRPASAASTVGGVDRLAFVEWGRIDPLYAACVYAVEEAVVDAMVAAPTMVGRDGHRVPGLPVDRVLALVEQAGRLHRTDPGE